MSAIHAVRLIQQVSNCDGSIGACWTAGSWARFQLLVNRDNNLHALQPNTIHPAVSVQWRGLYGFLLKFPYMAECCI